MPSRLVGLVMIASCGGGIAVPKPDRVRVQPASVSVAAVPESMPVIHKRSIAVLGLEMIGTIDARGLTVTSELTDGLRGRAASKLGRYDLSPSGRKELVEVKLMASCGWLVPTCMTEIGHSLGADLLLFGTVNQQVSGSTVKLTLVDVAKGSIERTLIEPFDLTADMQLVAKTLYTKIAGDTQISLSIQTTSIAASCSLMAKHEPSSSTVALG